MLFSEYVGIVTLPILLGLANVGGIGGGGLIIPLAIGCWGFNTAEAVAISNSTVFMGALIRYIGFSIHEKHPSSPVPKTVIDYDLASIMMPAVMFGAFTGLYLSVMLPAAVTTIVLTLILCYMTWNTTKKMKTLCQKESRERLNYHELPSAIGQASEAQTSQQAHRHHDYQQLPDNETSPVKSKSSPTKYSDSSSHATGQQYTSLEKSKSKDSI